MHMEEGFWLDHSIGVLGVIAFFPLSNHPFSGGCYCGINIRAFSEVGVVSIDRLRRGNN